MGGRPPVVGLLALAVAVLLASPIAAPRAAAEIRIPLPGSDSKPKVIPRKYFRPTLPTRNPTRVTAGISADAVSPPQAKDSAAAVVAGTASSASAALALPHTMASLASTPEPSAPPTDNDTASAEAAAPEPSSDAGDEAEPPTETANDSSPDDAAPEPAAEQPEEDERPVETAEADKPDAAAETPADPVEEQPDETAEPEPAADPVEEEADAAKPEETAALTETPAPDEPAPSPAPSDAKAAPEPEPAETVEAAAATDPPESEPAAEADERVAETPDEAETADAEPASEPEAVASEPVVTAAVPSLDASVILEVAPPPEETLAAAAEPADAAIPAPDPKEAAPKETEVAALTPPNDPVPAPPPAAKEETAEDAPLDTAPSEDEKVEAAEVEEAPADAEPAPKDEDRIAPETAGTPGEDAEQPDAAASETGADQTASDEEAPAPVVEAPPAHPVVAAIRGKLAEPDLRKTAAASDLDALIAIYEAHEEPPLWVTDAGFSDKAKAIIAEIAKAGDWGLDAASFDLPPAGADLATTDAQAAGEIKLSIAILSYARDAQIGRLTPSKVSSLFDQHPKLRDPKTVLTEMAAASSPGDYLTSLHPQHDQFKRLHAALKSARATAQANGRNPDSDRDVQLIVINMERWRWLPRQLGSYYVWNNVPEFQVRVMKGGKPIYVEKTIVGQYKYATPFFSAPMRNIVFHPNWTVPPTIVKEDLAPKLQGSSGGFFSASKTATLRRYGLSVSQKGQPIDADSVDWNNVNIHAYTFTQDPGPANVLGKFKFNFPNRHAIYMHDTVQPELFAETTRTLSHGCIRVNQPDRFATLLLAEDKGWSEAQVRNLVAKNESTVISFNRTVPVHLTYFTAVVDENGRLNTLGDIYGIDNRMAAKLFDNPARFPIPAEAVAESSAQDQPRQRQRAGGGLDNFISGLFGN